MGASPAGHDDPPSLLIGTGARRRAKGTKLPTLSDEHPLNSFLLRTVAVGIQTTLIVVAVLSLLPFVPGAIEVDALVYFGALLAAAVAVLWVSMLPWRRLFRSRWGQRLLYLWSIFDILVITVLVAASGGGDSELFWLYGVTTLFFTIAYPRRSHPALAGFTFASYLVAVWAGGWNIDAGTLALRFSVLGSLTWLGSFLARELMMMMTTTHRSATEMRSIDEMKNSFLVALSHELRTPLTVALGFAHTLHRHEQRLSSEMRRDFAGKIVEHTRRMTRLLDDLLDIQHLAEGVVEPQHRHFVDIGWLVEGVVERFDLAATHPVEISTTRVVLPIDEPKVERLVECLLSNVAKHTPPGTTACVQVCGAPDGGMIVVEDTGPGIAPGLKQEIFELFRQGPDVPLETPGIGIGLYLVHRIATLHGGRAWAEDRTEGGSRFYVLLPGRATEAL